jgi:vacuolar-type H+-ATPase subunit H
MDELLEKIKKTEEEAALIVSNADEKAKKLIEDERQAASLKLIEAKKVFFEQFNKVKEQKLIDAEKKREQEKEKKISDFKKSLGDLEQKQKASLHYLTSVIKDKLGI